MARGSSLPAVNPLPKVSFIKVADEVTQQTPGVHDHVARSYGYNDSSDFIRPEHYIRYIEPLESDLAVQVEYDMDEQDQEWLDAVNLERKAQQLDKVSYETFEIIMDRLEKEWFDLTKNIPKSDMALPSEDSTCAVCDDSEGENTNAIVFCDGCNLAVHQDCYGVPYIPEGQWLCRKCTVSPEVPVSCILCPNEGGAFKQTNSGEWVHLLCAIWVPETAVANEIFMEPITGIEKISKQRWKLRCSVCEIRHGSCIQCSKTSCFTAFHATCARKEKLLMPMKASQGSEAPTLACFCEKHLPREQQEVRAAAQRAEHSDDSEADPVHSSSKSNKTARAYAKTYKPGPPLVPRIIVNRILQYISRIHLRHKPEFLYLVCKYWSLKREARRGAPLLKRLHLEPWTALTGSKQQTDEEKAMKLDHMKRLRMDLERLCIVADVVQRREHTKQKQADAIQSVLLHFFFPHEAFLRLAFQKIIMHDRQEYFRTPVNKAEVPDYYDVIKDPMCWDMIDQKLDRHEYLDLAEFKRDINLVLSNAMIYNQANTPFYKTASRMQGNARVTLAELDRLVQHPAHPETQPPSEEVPHPPMLDPESAIDEKPHIEVESVSPPPQLDAPGPGIGDLEPPLDLLDLLVSEPSIRNDTNIIVLSNPIQSLLNYELPLIRPAAPPPPPLRRVKSQRGKYNRKAALDRKKLERQHALDASPGFRAPRTRSGLAAVAVSEAEAAQSPVAGEQEHAYPSTPAQERARKPRRSHVVPPPDLPNSVDEVDNRKLFTMFERGWILPPDQKRGGRVAVERQPPPPKKKTKMGHEKSVLPDPSAAPHDEDLASAMMTPGDYSVSEPPVASGSAFATTAEPSRSPGTMSTRQSVGEVEGETLPLVTPFDVTVSRQVTPQPAHTPTSVPTFESPSSSADPLPQQTEPVVTTGDNVLPAGVDTASPPPREHPIPSEAPSSAEQPTEQNELSIEELVPETLDLEDHQVSPMAVDPPQAPPEPPSPERNEEEHTGPRRIIYIETLDTPATRREKAQRKKAEREAARMRAAAEAAAALSPAPVAGPSRLAEDGMDIDSDLTDLSDMEDDDAGDRRVVVPPPAPARYQPPAEPGVIVLKGEDKLEGGTLVWAKIGSYPWWPAVVFEEDDPEVPPNVLESVPDRSDRSFVLVRFYEKSSNNNWAWVRLKNMRYLGEDDTLDAQMLAPTSKYQRWRNPNRRSECRNAYQDALAEMEAEEQQVDVDSTGVFSANDAADPTSQSISGGVVEEGFSVDGGSDSPMTEVD